MGHQASARAGVSMRPGHPMASMQGQAVAFGRTIGTSPGWGPAMVPAMARNSDNSRRRDAATDISASAGLASEEPSTSRGGRRLRESRSRPVLGDKLRRAWSKEEDEALVKLVELHGASKWNMISEEFNKLGLGGAPRDPKACRLRWSNQLDSRLNHGPFTEEENRTIIELHRIHGNKWALIAAALPGRTDNAVKNQWNCKLAKALSNSASPSGGSPTASGAHRTFVAQAVVKPPERPVTPRHARELTEEIQGLSMRVGKGPGSLSLPQMGTAPPLGPPSKGTLGSETSFWRAASPGVTRDDAFPGGTSPPSSIYSDLRMPADHFQRLGRGISGWGRPAGHLLGTSPDSWGEEFIRGYSPESFLANLPGSGPFSLDAIGLPDARGVAMPRVAPDPGQSPPSALTHALRSSDGQAMRSAGAGAHPKANSTAPTTAPTAPHMALGWDPSRPARPMSAGAWPATTPSRPGGSSPSLSGQSAGAFLRPLGTSPPSLQGPLHGSIAAPAGLGGSPTILESSPPNLPAFIDFLETFIPQTLTHAHSHPHPHPHGHAHGHPGVHASAPRPGQPRRPPPFFNNNYAPAGTSLEAVAGAQGSRGAEETSEGDGRDTRGGGTSSKGPSLSHAFMGMVSGRRVDTEVELEKLTRPLGEIGRKAQRQDDADAAHTMMSLSSSPPGASLPASDLVAPLGFWAAAPHGAFGRRDPAGAGLSGHLAGDSLGMAPEGPPQAQDRARGTTPPAAWDPAREDTAQGPITPRTSAGVVARDASGDGAGAAPQKRRVGEVDLDAGGDRESKRRGTDRGASPVANSGVTQTWGSDGPGQAGPSLQPGLEDAPRREGSGTATVAVAQGQGGAGLALGPPII